MKFIDESNGIMFNPKLVESFQNILPDILEIKERYAETSAAKVGQPL